MFGEDLIEPETPLSRRVPTRRETALRDIGGFRLVNNGYAQAIQVPPDAEFFMIVSEGGDSRLEIGGKDANSVSTFYAPKGIPICNYPIAPGQAISCYGAGASVIANFRFLGRIYLDGDIQ